MSEALQNGRGASASWFALFLASATLFIAFPTTRANTTDVTPCDFDNDPKYAKTIRFENHCYFVVNGSTKKTNPEFGGRRVYQFNVTLAREICESENATLPIIKSDSANTFLSKHFKEVKGEFEGLMDAMVALGLRQENTTTGFDYKWDDGSNLTYQPPTEKWHEKNESAYFTYLLSSGNWMNNVGLSKYFVFRVVCQKKFETVDVTKRPIPVAEGATVCDNFDNTTFIFAFRDNPQNESCYFAVIAMKEAVTVKGKKYIFDVAKARTICARHNATLPIINSKFENDLFVGLIHLAKKNLSVPLGLKRSKIGNVYKWDDNSDFDFEGVWNTKYSYDNVHHVALDWIGDWQSFASDESDNELLVFCEQPYPNRRIETRFTTAPPLRSKCNTGAKAAYPNTAVWKDAYCYFVVAGATVATNQIMQVANVRYIRFDVWQARKICKREGATLLSLHSEDEYHFVNSAFDPSHFDPASELGVPVTFIALGLQQKKFGAYEWDEGAQMIWHPGYLGKEGEWDKKVYAYFTVTMIKEKHPHWLNAPIGVVGSGVGVLCKQDHQRDPSVPQISSPPTKPPPVPPPEEPVSYSTDIHCHPRNKRKFLHTAVYNYDELCYFIVPDATRLANLKAGGDKHEFSITSARSSCQQYGATLPIILSRGEADFILSNFASAKFKKDIVFKMYSGIALGIKIDGRRGRYRATYKWDDGTPLMYEAEDWENRDLIYDVHSFVYMDVFSKDRIKWKTGRRHDTFGFPIAVLCQQDINQHPGRKRDRWPDGGSNNIHANLGLMVAVTQVIMAMKMMP